MTTFLICSPKTSATLIFLCTIANKSQAPGKYLPVTLAKRIRLFLVVNGGCRVYLSCASQNDDSSNSLRIYDKKTIFFLIPIILYSPETGAATKMPGLIEMRRRELPREVKMSRIAKKRWRL
jgi:hypothetical protein